MAALDPEVPVVTANATGCLEVTTTIYPFTAWKGSYIHSAFENAAATISGVETAYKSLKKQGKIPDKPMKFVAFGGDGGTYDIGLQSLSGAMERGHDIVYICYDNNAYANTGIQRSSATPKGASTTTSPAGRVIPGKPQHRKDLTAIMAAHNIPYVAQASVSHHTDLMKKVEKAFNTTGPAFINVLSPCRLTWGTPPEETIDIARQAVNSCFWPLYEVEDGQWKLTYRPKEKTSYIDWLKRQTRFRHLFKPEPKQEVLEELQAEVDRRWKRLLQLCGEEE
ncbi:MAG: pyruvate ferredoxin oxidoreductase [Firmicutes bacterium]|nr:pyruvate ferredoxin oxidoreductase [Bacillota bacterium]